MALQTPHQTRMRTPRPERMAALAHAVSPLENRSQDYVDDLAAICCQSCICGAYGIPGKAAFRMLARPSKLGMVATAGNRRS